MPEKTELLSVPGFWNLPYNYSAGETVSKFLIEIRDNGRIMGTKCGKCNRVIVPARSYCERCFISIKDSWVELTPKGTVAAFTLVTMKFEGLPDPPYIVAYIKIDGADTTFPHYLTGVDLSDTSVTRDTALLGKPVRIVFKNPKDRQARMTDFRVELIQ